MSGEWIKEFPAAVTVCDLNGTIIEMNERSCLMFAKDGGQDLIGKNLLECHPEAARRKIEQMLTEPQTNCYTTEKNGRKNFIYQSPWFNEGKFMGIVEIVFEVPMDIPNHKR